MSDPARNYRQATRSALIALSQGTCYEPSCPRPLVVFDDGEPYTNFDVAHIRDAKPGNRYDPNMTDKERASFKNLVLLCRVHHTKVDKTHPEDFSIELLEQWKLAAAEGNVGEVEGSSHEELEQLLRDAASMVRASSTSTQLAELFGEVEKFLILAEGSIRAVNEIQSELEAERSNLSPIHAVQDGRPVILNAELPQATLDAFRERMQQSLKSGVLELQQSAESTRVTLAALAGALNFGIDDYVAWITRSQQELLRALDAWDEESYQLAKAAVVDARDAVAALVRNEEAPPVPIAPPMPEPSSPTASESATLYVEDLVSRAQAAQSHEKVGSEVLSALLEVGGQAKLAGPLGTLSSDALESCGYWIAHFLKQSRGELPALLSTIAALEPFELRFHAVRQLYFALEGDSASQHSIRSAGLDIIVSAANRAEHGLLGEGFNGDAPRMAIWTWEWWADSPEGPSADLALTIDGLGPCEVLTAFAYRATVGGAPRLTFYRGLGRPPENPIPLVTDRLVVEIQRAFPDLQPADELPCRSETTSPCESLASEYLLLASSNP